ncbi:MAG: imidazole glycerol phosphate synthase subunit HisH [Spirochaetia bacterium]|jgi:cyclase|nr:imidazole glycerol phosphate synthase subunit HisH [Spirochaetia bacterium]
MRVTIVDTGRSNAASLAVAFERVGADIVISADPVVVKNAAYVVLPGVGAFGAVADRLRAMGMDSVLKERVQRSLPTLGVCLGMQLFFESSDESPGARGLGAIPGAISAYGPGVRSPQFGWNRVLLPGDGGDAYAYFANSYKLDAVPLGWRGAMASYGGPFVAAIERGPVLLCQFHPELSGAWGQALLARWMQVGSSDGVSDDSSTGTLSCLTLTDPGGRVAQARLLDADMSFGTSNLPRIIPCLDVSGGRVVKGVRFKELRDAGDPAELAARYEAEGADEIVMLDIGAGVEGRPGDVDVVRTVRRRIGIPLCIGGGIRELSDAQRVLEAGADKVSLNSRAFREPTLLTEIAREFGRQCCVLAVDAARNADGSPMVVLDAGKTVTGTTVVDWIVRGVEAGAGELLLTSRDRDGTRSGYDLELLRQASLAVSGVPVIASGGAATPEQILEGLRSGAAALLAGALHDRSLSIATIKNYMRQNGVEVR